MRYHFEILNVHVRNNLNYMWILKQHKGIQKHNMKLLCKTFIEQTTENRDKMSVTEYVIEI